MSLAVYQAPRPNNGAKAFESLTDPDWGRNIRHNQKCVMEVEMGRGHYKMTENERRKVGKAIAEAPREATTGHGS